MLDILRDLVDHKNYANFALLNAIAQHETGSADPKLRRLLHHVILANRFWVALISNQEFNADNESTVPDSLQAVTALYRETGEYESRWISGIQELDLDRTVATPFLPDRTISLAQALVQVCLHSHGHRAQCTARLRDLGGEPPPTEFIVWLKDRPAPNWTHAK